MDGKRRLELFSLGWDQPSEKKPLVVKRIEHHVCA